MFHDKAGHRLDLFFLILEAFAFIPAPRLFIFTHATQVDFIRQKRAGESEQPAAEVTPLIFRGYEQLIEIHLRQVQRQHRRDDAVIVGDKQAPASLDLERNARAQFRQQKVARLFKPGRYQLFIQTRAISSCSSARAGRIAGGFIGTNPTEDKKNPRDIIARVSPASKRKTYFEARSKRSRFITLFHAATKSFTNFSFESAHA